MHGRVRHGDCRARGGDLDQLKPSLNFGLVYAARWLSRASRPHVPHRPLRFALLGASKCPNEAATAIWLHVNYAIDYVSSSCYRIRILAHRGASPETIPKAERGVASCGRRLVTARPGRPGKSPARHYDLAARSSLHGSKPAEASATAGAGDGSAAPRPKTATVERREASVPRHGTHGASQAPGVSRHKRVHARL